MWEFIARQLLKEAGRKIGSRFFNDEANGPEFYADRIKRDLGLQDYADAWAIYDSDRAYWEQYYNGQSREPDWKQTAVRDSAAAAGVPSRNNVVEYDFPQPAPVQTRSEGAVPVQTSTSQFLSQGQSTIVGGRTAEGAPLAGAGFSTPKLPTSSPLSEASQSKPGVFTTGVPPIPYVRSPQGAPRGIPGMMVDAGYVDPTNPDPPPAGGLAGLLQDYLRNNPGAGR
jgi:hypothetical protein